MHLGGPLVSLFSHMHVVALSHWGVLWGTLRMAACAAMGTLQLRSTNVHQIHSQISFHEDATENWQTADVGSIT